MIALRTFLAHASVALALVGFLAYAVYGLYLDDKLASFRRFETKLAKPDRWNPAFYPSEAEQWLARDRSWHRWRNVVWLGCIALGNAFYLVLKP
jgi:uncharacterized membrane protein YozB (DUF420 family)